MITETKSIIAKNEFYLIQPSEHYQMPFFSVSCIWNLLVLTLVYFQLRHKKLSALTFWQIQCIGRKNLTPFHWLDKYITWRLFSRIFRTSIPISERLIFWPRVSAWNFMMPQAQYNVATACLLTRWPRITAWSLTMPFRVWNARRACKYKAVRIAPTEQVTELLISLLLMSEGI